MLDIATHAGNSGVWIGSHEGTRAGATPPFQVCFNLQYLIARRYRGGKPKGFFPFGTVTDYQSPVAWEPALVATVQNNFALFIAALAASSFGSFSTVAHVSLSYKSGFTNVANSSGRERANPTYRPAALVDPVIGYRGHVTFGSQKRRRTSTTP